MVKFSLNQIYHHFHKKLQKIVILSENG